MEGRTSISNPAQQSMPYEAAKLGHEWWDKMIDLGAPIGCIRCGGQTPCDCRI